MLKKSIAAVEENKIFTVVIPNEVKRGIIPAIICGHMQAPALYAQTDYSTFEQDDKEKGKTLTAKYQHKQDLRHHYGTNWRKYLNIPGKGLATQHFTF